MIPKNFVVKEGTRLKIKKFGDLFIKNRSLYTQLNIDMTFQNTFIRTTGVFGHLFNKLGFLALNDHCIIQKDISDQPF